MRFKYCILLTSLKVLGSVRKEENVLALFLSNASSPNRIDRFQQTCYRKCQVITGIRLVKLDNHINQKEKYRSPNYPLSNPTQNDNSYGSLDPLLVVVGDLEACERYDGGVDVLGEGKDDDGHLGGPQHQHHDPHVDEAGQWAEELVQG